MGDRLAWTEQMSERSRMIDLTEPVERAFLIGLDNPRDGQWPVARSLAELGALAETAGAAVVGSAFQRRAAPDPVWYFGKGRAAELVDEKAASNFNLLVVDDELAPNQQRSLETLLDCKVLDRSALIIDIFARHARTREGRLQVELAALQYHLPRLTRMWTHLSRTAGGIGTRGPGESQLETDRRLIREKIRKVRTELDEVKRHRATTGRQRDRAEVATVALVGYTNAGKSTLLNALADADVYAADMLFATLDPTARAVSLPTGQRIVLSDTVGFINKLPHDLVEAFRATLEEVIRADLLLEVVDAAIPTSSASRRRCRRCSTSWGGQQAAHHRLQQDRPAGCRSARRPDAGQPRHGLRQRDHRRGLPGAAWSAWRMRCAPRWWRRHGGAVCPRRAGGACQGLWPRGRVVHRDRHPAGRSPATRDRRRGAQRGGPGDPARP